MRSSIPPLKKGFLVFHLFRSARAGEVPDAESLTGYLSADVGDALPSAVVARIANVDDRATVLTAVRDCLVLVKERAPNELAAKIDEAMRTLLAHTPDEIDNLLRGLNGEYVPPAPGGELLRGLDAIETRGESLGIPLELVGVDTNCDRSIVSTIHASRYRPTCRGFCAIALPTFWNCSTICFMVPLTATNRQNATSFASTPWNRDRAASTTARLDCSQPCRGFRLAGKRSRGG